jgi:hypothetical protein
MKESEAPLWLTTEQIRKRVRCRRRKVIEAQDAGCLAYERRGRIRYSPLWAVEQWEHGLVKDKRAAITIRRDLAHFA